MNQLPEDWIDKIIIGDCMFLAEKLPDLCIDMVITDPPYGIISDRCSWDPKNIEEFTKKWWEIIKTKAHGFYVFWSQKYIPLGYEIFNPDRMLIWHHPNLAKTTNRMYLWTYDPIFFIKGKKFNGNFSRSLNTDVKTYAIPQSNFKKDRKFHETQKPLQLIKDLIEVSTDLGDTILDPFVGSGTTAVAAQQLKRRFIGFDISPKNVYISNQRLVQEMIT